MEENLYRSRLSRKADDLAKKFMSSASEDDWILEEDIDNTEAHDIMLYEQSIIPLEDLKKILKTLEKVKLRYRKGELSIPYIFEDVHEFIEHFVTEELGIDVGGKVHTGRSRNDQVATDVRMKVRSELNEISEKTISFIETLISCANKNVDTTMVLYTHTQHAQIGCFAHYLLAYIDHLFRDLERIEDCYERVNLNPLGSCAMGGSSFNLNRNRTTKLLGFDGLLENSIDSVSTRDFALETASILAILMSNLSRIAEDIILWSTSEFDYVEIADEYASTSSVMPQKKNPCTLELIRARTCKVYSNLLELLAIMKGLPTGYSRDLQETKTPLRLSFKLVKDSLDILKRIFSTIKINKKKMCESASDSYALAIDLAEELVRQGLSFREAHKVVGESVRILAEAGKKINSLDPELLEKLSAKILRKKVSIGEKKLKNILNPEYSLSKRLTKGGATPQEVRRMSEERVKILLLFKERLEERIRRVNKAKKLLSKTVSSVLS